MNNRRQLPIDRYGVNRKKSLQKEEQNHSGGRRAGLPFQKFRGRRKVCVKNARFYDIKSLKEQKKLNHFKKAADTIGVIVEETALKLTDREFLKQLNRYIQFRAIDIVLHLRDGSVVELDKNRRMEGRMIICHNRTGGQEFIAIDDIRSAEFFAA